MRLNGFDADGGDRIAFMIAPDLGRAAGNGNADYKLSVIEFAYHGFGQFKVYTTVFRKIYLAQLDRVEGHGDLVNR